MVLEKTLGSPLDSKIKPVNPKGNEPCLLEMVDGITNSMGMSLCKFQKLVKDKEAWRASVHVVTKSQT